jgi:hypothetical protein
MFSEQRRKTRKPISAVAFIYTLEGRPIGECGTLDISETGAKLKWAAEGELPPEFLLSLSRNGKVRRRCHLKWREPDKIGVRFVLE